MTINDQRRVCEMLYVNFGGKILEALFLKNSTTWLAVKIGTFSSSTLGTLGSLGTLGVVIMAVMRPPELVPAIKSKYSHRLCSLFPSSSYSQPCQQPDVADPCQFPQEFKLPTKL